MHFNQDEVSFLALDYSYKFMSKECEWLLTRSKTKEQRAMYT